MNDAALDEAARRLACGELVAFPTETVYGLGARADDDHAVARIFEAKGRPSDHPLIVHAADAQAAEAFAAEVPGAARRLMQRFWPGPLTLILKRRPGVAGAAAGGQDSIGLRVPSHPLALALLRKAAALGVPGVAAPSANRFGRVSPTTAEHVRAEFPAGVFILDGGDCEVGVESTIVDFTGAAPALLRPGGLPRRDLEEALGAPLAGRQATSPRASGTLEVHYAPAARVVLMAPHELDEAVAAQPRSARQDVAVYSFDRRSVPQGMRWRQIPTDASAAQRELFAALRRFDAQGVQEIWVERAPDEPAWEAWRDRLQRAAAR